MTDEFAGTSSDSIFPPAIVVGSTAEYVSLTILGRSHPDCSDYSDGNWIKTAIDVLVGGFRGRVLADLRTEELDLFRSELRTMHELLIGQARFQTMEDWLLLEMRIDRRGHVVVSGALRDEPGVGNLLKFNLTIDQTYLRGIIKALDATLAKFPVIGKP